jgi:hypothetical protein
MPGQVNGDVQCEVHSKRPVHRKDGDPAQDEMAAAGDGRMDRVREPAADAGRTGRNCPAEPRSQGQSNPRAHPPGLRSGMTPDATRGVPTGLQFPIRAYFPKDALSGAMRGRVGV